MGAPKCGAHCDHIGHMIGLKPALGIIVMSAQHCSMSIISSSVCSLLRELPSVVHPSAELSIQGWSCGCTAVLLCQLLRTADLCCAPQILVSKIGGCIVSDILNIGKKETAESDDIKVSEGAEMMVTSNCTFLLQWMWSANQIGSN